VNHPNGAVAVLIGDARCRFQLDLHAFSADQFPSERDQAAVAECDRSAAFRWSEFSVPDALGAQIAAATLAATADGVVSWQRAKGGWCRGEQAFSTIRSAAHRDLEKVLGGEFSPANPFGPVVEVAPLATGWLECPRCSRRFSPQSDRNWDGEKHLGCGQVIRIRA
jgi:hypothetical protein